MGMGGFGTCQVLMVHGVATSLIPWASQRRLSWCHTSERLSWSTAAWRCWPGSAWWHLTLSAFLVRSFPLRLCQCPLMPTMLSLGLLVSMLKCCSGWALWSCAAPRRSLNGTPWRSLVTTAHQFVPQWWGGSEEDAHSRAEERPLGYDGIRRCSDPGCPHPPSVPMAVLRCSWAKCIAKAAASLVSA